MKTWISSSSDWAVVMLVGIAVPAATAVGFLAAGNEEAAGMIGILAGIFLGIVALATHLAHRVTEQQTGATMGLAPGVISAIESIPGLELLDELLVAPPSQVTVAVAGVTGVCARGFRLGDTWGIDSYGHLSRPLCLPAARAISTLLEEWPEGQMECDVPCRCPLAERELVFAARFT